MFDPPGKFLGLSFDPLVHPVPAPLTIGKKRSSSASITGVLWCGVAWYVRNLFMSSLSTAGRTSISHSERHLIPTFVHVGEELRSMLVFSVIGRQRQLSGYRLGVGVTRG